MENSDKEILRRKAVQWLNRQSYHPRKGNHFILAIFIFSVVVCFMCLLIVVVVDFGEDIDLYFSSMRNQVSLIITIVFTCIGFVFWLAIRRYRNF